MIATSGFLAALKCTKFVIGWGFAPNTTGGAYNAPPDPLVGLKEEGKGWKEERKRRRGKKGNGRDPLSQISGSTPGRFGYSTSLVLLTQHSRQVGYLGCTRSR